MKSSKTGSVAAFIRSFYYAGRGIARTFKEERNMRFHIILMTYMFSFLLFGDWFIITGPQWCALLICCALVISLELLNTALENAVNLASGGKISDFAMKAKDAAAGAVLVSAVVSIIVGVIIMLQKEAFIAMYGYFRTHLWALALVAVSLVPACFIIFHDFKRSGKEENKK